MKKILFLLILIIPFYSYSGEEETFNSFALKMDSWVEGLRDGVVVSSKGSSAVISLGRNMNVLKGMEFETVTDGEELLHPVTGESLGKKQVVSSKMVIDRVSDKYSDCKVIKNNGVKKGDRVVFRDKSEPYLIKMSFKNLSEAEVADARFSVLRSGLFEENDESDYLVSCGREKAGDSVAECVLSYKGEKVIKSAISVKGTKIITAKQTVQINTGDDFIKNSIKNKLGGGYYSVTAGYFYGKDKDIAFAVSERNKVIIYGYEKGGLVEKEVLSSFYYVVNVEALDVNGDGKEELFISNMTKKREPSSFVYEFNGKNIVQKQSNFPYFFRTFYINGKKELVCQGYVEGAMNGKIYKVFYIDDNKQYEALDPYVRSYGAGIYGFAYGSIGGRTETNTIFFNPQGILNIAGESGTVSYKKASFGNTANIIVHTERLSTGINVGDSGSDGGGYFVYDEQNIAVPVFQRIIEIESGKLLLYSNIPKKKKKSFGVYKKGIVGEYILTSQKAVPMWEKTVESDAVVEIDISSDGRYLAFITADGWRALNIGSSFINVIKLY